MIGYESEMIVKRILLHWLRNTHTTLKLFWIILWSYTFVLFWPFFVLKEPRHLQFIADFSDSDVYTVLSAKKLHGAPTDYGLCVKVPSLSIKSPNCTKGARVLIPGMLNSFCLLLTPSSSPQSVVQLGTWSCFVRMMSRPGPAGSQPCAC